MRKELSFLLRWITLYTTSAESFRGAVKTAVEECSWGVGTLCHVRWKRGWVGSVGGAPPPSEIQGQSIYYNGAFCANTCSFFVNKLLKQTCSSEADVMVVGSVPWPCWSEVPHHNVHSLWIGGWHHPGSYHYLHSTSPQSTARETHQLDDIRTSVPVRGVQGLLGCAYRCRRLGQGAYAPPRQKTDIFFWQIS